MIDPQIHDLHGLISPILRQNFSRRHRHRLRPRSGESGSSSDLGLWTNSTTTRGVETRVQHRGDRCRTDPCNFLHRKRLLWALQVQETPMWKHTRLRFFVGPVTVQVIALVPKSSKAPDLQSPPNYSKLPGSYRDY